MTTWKVLFAFAACIASSLAVTGCTVDADDDDGPDGVVVTPGSSGPPGPAGAPGPSGPPGPPGGTSGK